MQGFKSFAKYTELVFGEHYNCVLGPNGSGKSNVLDSLTFVLGKSGSKSMRAEKSANLIYNGGKSKNPHKKGEVSIFFDNKDKTFPTEETEVKITRIIKSNGQSIYKINDQVRTRQQIVDLLGLAKIDPDGYNIILQGDIVRFCDMSTNDRRLLIEEISGISIYEEKKQKALTQLNKVEERLKEAEIILSERQTYLKELKKDRDQALKFKELSDNVKKFKASLCKLHLDKNEKDSTELKEKIDKNTQALQQISEKVEKFKEEISQKKEKIETITKEIEQKGEGDQVSLNREIENIKIEMTKKNSRIETLNTETQKIDQRKQDLEKDQQEVNERIEKITKEKGELNTKKSDLEKERTGITEKIKAFKQKNNVESAEGIEKRIDEIDKRLEELSKEIHILRETQHNALREKDKVDHELSALASAMEKVAQIEKEHKQQMDEVKEKRSEFKKTTLELNKRLDEESHLTAKLNDARNKLHLSREELAKLNARNLSIKEFSLRDTAIKEVLKRKNETPGIYGTVSELGKVDSKYSLALEIAAGSRIKSIVVEDDKIAADQIKFLRANKLGTATFLPLSKIKPKGVDEKAKSLIKAKGSHGVATDLVSYDSKFKKIFSYVFGDTVVVDNLDAMRRLGIGKAKMVTLEGDLADTAGAMRGGFRDKKRTGMGFSEAKLDKDIQSYESNVSELEGSISGFESRRKEIESVITDLRSKKAELEGEIIKAEKSLHLDSSDLSLSQKKSKDLKEKEASLEKEINEIQDTISEKNKELATLKIERGEHRSKIVQLREPTLIAELSTYEEKSRQLTEQIMSTDVQTKNMDVQLKDIFLPQIEKTKSILKQIEKEESVFKKEAEDLTKEVQSTGTELKKKEEEAKAFYAAFKESFHQRSLLSEQISKHESQIAMEMQKSRELEIKNNTLSIKNAEVSATLAGLQEEFSQYGEVELDKEKNEEQLKYQLQRFEKMKEEVGTVNMRALEIYEQIEKEYGKLLEKKDTLGKEKEDVEQMMTQIDAKKKELFMKTYDSVNEEFQKIFLSLSKKGEASLELENKEDPFAEGARIKVRLSGQKFLDIRSLSGGEKTMTALAFIFAIQEHDPASFYILDEVDAALDKHNSEKLAKLIRSYSTKAQYIIISHNDSIISEADSLYGVSMDEHGMSKVVSLKV